MKILYIHQYFRFPQTAGGTRSYDLSKLFALNGVDVVVITTSAGVKVDNWNGKRWKYLEKDGIKLWVLNCSYGQKMSMKRRIISFIQFLWFSSLKVLSLDAELVLATSTPLTVAVPALVKKLCSGTPYIFEVRDVWPEVPIQLGYIKNRFSILFLQWFEKTTYRNASCVVALSIGMQECIEKRISGIKKIEVIPNISEVTRFSVADNPSLYPEFNFPGKKVILYAGTLGAVNHILYVAELAAALSRINIVDVVFCIVGDGREKEDIVRYCEEEEILNKNIFFFSPVPKQALPLLYSKCCMGSSFVSDNKVLWDNSANKFFDTLAAGRPILINHEGWQAEVIRKHNCGYVLPPILSDIEVDRFVNYLNDEKLLEMQRNNAKETAQTKYSLEIAGKKYLDIVTSVLEDSCK